MRLDLRQVADIPAKSQRLGSCLPNLLDGSIDCPLIDIRDGHLRPFTRQRDRDRAPQAAAAAENERRLSLQS
jgi:hypothetical protein